MYALPRAALFALAPERSHDLTLAALRLYGELPGPIRPLNGIPRRCFGLDFDNPVGLAAGLDKNAEAVLGLARLGFAFVEVGTVTPRPQPGNAQPRLFRLPSRGALINRMGFNNAGVRAMVRRLQRLRDGGRLTRTRLGVNLGKNRGTALAGAAADYCACLGAVHPHADYVTLNLSSPNTPGLRALQSGAALVRLLEPVRELSARLDGSSGRRVPLLLKVAPDLQPEDVEDLCAAVKRFAIDGLIATNTTVARPGVEDHPLAGEAGGLSGEPLAPLSLTLVRTLRERLPELPIIGAGGIHSGASGAAMLRAGADLLQIYTGLIYRGPALVRELAELPPAP